MTKKRRQIKLDEIFYIDIKEFLNEMDHLDPIKKRNKIVPQTDEKQKEELQTEECNLKSTVNCQPFLMKAPLKLHRVVDNKKDVMYQKANNNGMKIHKGLRYSIQTKRNRNGQKDLEIEPIDNIKDAKRENKQTFMQNIKPLNLGYTKRKYKHSIYTKRKKSDDIATPEIILRGASKKKKKSVPDEIEISSRLGLI